MRKTIMKIEERSLDLARNYSWPGNIRELQNVVERSVVLCDGEIFLLDEHWLSPELLPQGEHPPIKRIELAERTVIEDALRQSKGRIAGPSGAAIKLGIPSSTLESRLKAMKINKHRFKTA
jgi:DNA-binding NtrC family response regulator